MVVKRNYDITIIGSGLSGILLALELDEKFNVLLITKGKLENSNSFKARGGICISKTPKEKDTHIKDSYAAGQDKANLANLKSIINSSSDLFKKLVKYGVEFDMNGNVYDKTLEGGHTQRIIYHAGGDATGQNIMIALIKKIKEKKNITIMENTSFLDFKVENKKIKLIHTTKGDFISKKYVFAMGGIGSRAGVTSNDKTISGDWIAPAKKHKLKLQSMDNIQIHPTGTIVNGEPILITESLRGEGATIVDENGNQFMKDIHPMGDLAPRDVVSKQIAKMDNAFLDTRHLGEEYVKNRFPIVYNELKKGGITLGKDLVKIVPIVHYLIGGIKAEIDGTTNIKNLLVIGENSFTGMHGKNRIASNSLLECGVMAINAAKKINEEVK